MSFKKLSGLILSAGLGFGVLGGCKSAMERDYKTTINYPEKEDARRYFPLSVGNTWTYKREVMPGKTALNRFRYTVIEDLDLDMTRDNRYRDKGDTRLQFGIEPSISSRNETYEVISKEGDGFIIKGSAYNEKGEKGLAEGYEPYTLNGGLEELVWEVSESAGLVDVYEIKRGIHLGDRVRCVEQIGYMGPEDGELVIVYSAGRIYAPGLLHSEPWYHKGGLPYDKKLTGYSSDVIEVPAGTFKKVFINTIKFIGGAKDETIKIVRFFAKDVGLIKEVQYDPKGETVYQLELITYKVK